LENSVTTIPIVAWLMLSVEMLTGLVFAILVKFWRKPNENTEDQHRADIAMWWGMSTFIPAIPVALLEAYFIRYHTIRIILLVVGVVLAIVLLVQNTRMIYYRLR